MVTFGVEDTGVEAAATRLPAASEETLCRRVVAEYREMPGLRLTEAQASRLFGIERGECSALLRLLVRRGALQRSADGCYCAASAQCGARTSTRQEDMR